MGSIANGNQSSTGDSSSSKGKSSSGGGDGHKGSSSSDSKGNSGMPSSYEMQSYDEDEATLANSLTVRGDMLAVCDELLEDDGVKFFDLLLKIAESRYHYRDELSGLDAADFDEDSDYLEEQRMEEGRR